MLDKLIEFFINCIRVFQFWDVLDEYEEGVILRLGRFHRAVGPGFHWLIPFYVDRILNDNVVPRTVTPPSQALSTADGKSVCLGVVITARIHDIRKALLEVENVDMVLKDSCWATVASHVGQVTWDELRTDAFADRVSAACRQQAFRYGVEIIRVRFCEATPIRAFRIIGGV